MHARPNVRVLSPTGARVRGLSEATSWNRFAFMAAIKTSRLGVGVSL